MKPQNKVLIIIGIIFILAVGRASAATYDWERMSYRYARYDIGYFDDAINVRLNMRNSGDYDGDMLDRFEYGVEDMWTTDRFDTPIEVDFNWVETDYNYSINVDDQYGRSSWSHWYTSGPWGDSYQEEVAAHEVGHFLGNYDEYESAWYIDPATGLVNTGGLMHTLRGDPLDYYYDDILEWFDNKTIITSSVPVPASIWLLMSGVVVLFRLRRIR